LLEGVSLDDEMTKWKVFFTIIFSLLVLSNLSARPLWQDEAETALVARQMVKSNVWLPYAYDDQGPISQDWNYQFSVSSLWRWHPWLQFYITALSFKLLGISAFSARLPFTLLGIAAYWYFLNFLVRHNPSLRGMLTTCLPAGRRGNPVFFFVATILMLFSTPLLLHLRQARYYSLSLFFTLLTIDGYLDTKRRLLATGQGVSSKYSIKYILGSVFLFHSFLPAALALQIAFWLNTLVIPGLTRNLYRFQLKAGMTKFAKSFLVTLLFTLPWAVWLKIGGQNLNFSPELIKQHLIQHYLYIHKFIFPLSILLPMLSDYLHKSLRATAGSVAISSSDCRVPRLSRGPRNDKLLARFFRDDKLVLFSIIISISLLLYTFNHPYFFRYLIPLIPLFIYIAAWIFTNTSYLWKIALALLFLQMNWRILPNFIHEITHPYRGANEQIIEFLTSLDKTRYQTLAVNYDDFTFRFHTQYRVFGAQQLTSQGLTFASQRLDLKTTNTCPDVVIIFPDWGNDTLLREISQNCQLEPHPLSLHYAKLADDPDPTNHRFTQPPLRTLEAFLAPPSPS
jgi:hypothetical protein